MARRAARENLKAARARELDALRAKMRPPEAA